MSAQNSFENDDVREPSAWTAAPWLRRALVFLLVGPTLAVLVALSPDVARTGFNSWLAIVGEMVFFFGLLVSAVTGLVDGMLSRTLAILLRAPLTALVGATVAIGVPAALFGRPPQEMSMALGIGGALCMGVCSLLSHNYRSAKA